MNTNTTYLTILDQLTQITGFRNTAYNRLIAMIGASHFVTDDNGNTIMFKFKGSKKYNFIKITLNSNDLYTVHMKKIWGTKFLNEFTINDVYCDQLKPLFEKQTGLYLCL